MNPRIREIALQSKQYALSAIIKIADKEQALMVYSESYDTKFAELIVQECLDLLWNSLTISADHVGVVDGIEYTGKEILIAAKECFGVEK